MKDENYIKSMKGLDFEPVERIDSKGKKVKATALPAQVVIMPKLNGVRMRWNPAKEALYTNNGNRVGSCDHIVEQIMDHREFRKLPLDGESYNHDPRYTFSHINGKTRRKESSKETEFLQFHLFDIADYESGAFKATRLDLLKEAFNQEVVGDKLIRVPYVIIHPDAVNVAFKHTLTKRFEGIMIFNPLSPYTEGKRSGTCWKWKPAYDAEFTFLHFNEAGEGTDRNKGTFGSIQFLMPDGQTFACAGISDEQRKKLFDNPPKVGTPFTVEYGDLSDTGVPIFPRLKDDNARWDQ